MNFLISFPVQRILKIVKAFGDFIYPPYCLSCKTQLKHGTELVCNDCFNKMPRIHIDDNIVAELKEKLQEDLYLSRVLSLWKFDELAQKLIHYLKYKNHWKIGRILAVQMVQLLGDNEIIKATEIIIPVPLHKARKRERGYNQSDIIAQNISVLTNKPVMKNILKRVINTKSQTKLSAMERKKNVEKAFVVTKQEEIRDKNVLLIDDVITTGSTINACAYQLKLSGAREVFALSAAKA